MVKKKTEQNLYLLAIVGIVAVVGIVVLVLNSGGGGVYVSESDLSGEATVAKPRYTGTLDDSFEKLAGIKKVKAVTQVAYLSSDGKTGGLATIYPVTTTDGKALLTKTSVLSATDKKNTFSMIVDMKTNDIIAMVTHTGEIKDYLQNADIAIIVDYKAFLGYGYGWLAINPDPELEEFMNPDALQEMFSNIGENIIFWKDCKAKCYPNDGCDVVCN